jgi:propionyl-CoA carboxylase alpha chain
VTEGSEISLFYDPMIAKLCTHAGSRAAAIEAMSDALDSFAIEGIRHNIPFLAALMAHPRWRAGKLSTAFIAEEFPDGFTGARPGPEERTILAAIGVSAALRSMRSPRIEGAEPMPGAIPAEWVIALDREQMPVRVLGDGPDALHVAIADAELTLSTEWRPGEPVWRGTVNGAEVAAQMTRAGAAFRLSRRGASITARLMTPRVAALAALMPEKKEADASRALLCPMPGLVVSVAVTEGQEVAPGEALATVEAMKMENVLRAERRATVARVLAKPGDSLAVDAVIMEFA